MVHGEDELQKVILASQALFGTADLATADVGTLIEATASAPSTEVDLANIPQVADLLVTLGLATSKGDAGRLMKGGGFYINNQQVDAGAAPTLTAEHFLGGRLCILRKGKKSYATVRVAGV
jgi:tyrosyl-tRNA synthetase